LRDYIQFLHHPRISGRQSAAPHGASVDAASADDLVSSFLGPQQPTSPLSSSLSADSSFTDDLTVGSAMLSASSSFPDTVYLGQIDERSGAFLAGKQKFRLYQKILFEDKDKYSRLDKESKEPLSIVDIELLAKFKYLRFLR
jgi:hypothetical protein